MEVLDAFCCAGGATYGYQTAGATVTGIDISPQPNYIGDDFIQGDAVEFITRHGKEFDFIHASPPCQAHTLAQRIQQNEHADLIEPTRAALRSTGRPYVIENVVGAPLINPVMLCGAMFPSLRVYRHRLFECSFPVTEPSHVPHIAPVRKMGRPPCDGDFMHVVGNFSGVQYARNAMGIHWMTRNELRESIPPAYTRYIIDSLTGVASTSVVIPSVHPSKVRDHSKGYTMAASLEKCVLAVTHTIDKKSVTAVIASFNKAKELTTFVTELKAALEAGRDAEIKAALPNFPMLNDSTVVKDVKFRAATVPYAPSLAAPADADDVLSFDL